MSHEASKRLVFDLLLAQLPHVRTGREAEDELGIDLLLAFLCARTWMRVAEQPRDEQRHNPRIAQFQQDPKLRAR